MLKTMKLNGKILGAIALTLFSTSAVSFWITQRRVNQQAEEAFRDEVRVVAGITAATSNWSSANVEFSDVAKKYATDRHMTFRTPSLHPRDAKNQPRDLVGRFKVGAERSQRSQPETVQKAFKNAAGAR